jgi:uncharacterized protein
MDTVIYSLSFAAIAFVVAVAFKPLDRRLTLIFCLLFAIYLALDDLATGLPKLSPLFGFLPGRWNWEGKIYSILLSVAVILALGISPKAVGLTLAQRNIKASVITTILYIPWAVTLGLLFKPGISAETLAFQATMPGLAEELALRGVAPALLLGLIRGRQPPEATPWAVVFITAIMFGVWHGFGYSDGAFSLEPISALLTGFGGLIACWLRFNSGSLLFPVLLHGLANVAFHLTALVGT